MSRPRQTGLILVIGRSLDEGDLVDSIIKKLELNNNVKKLTYEKSTGLWYIQYNNGRRV